MKASHSWNKKILGIFQFRFRYWVTGPPYMEAISMLGLKWNLSFPPPIALTSRPTTPLMLYSKHYSVSIVCTLIHVATSLVIHMYNCMFFFSAWYVSCWTAWKINGCSTITVLVVEGNSSQATTRGWNSTQMSMLGCEAVIYRDICELLA